MNSQSFLYKLTNKWLKSIDLVNIFLLFFLIILGILSVTSASPSVAKLKGLGEFHFIKKHYFFVILSITTMLVFSLFSLKGIINISYLGFFVFSSFLLILLALNYENNGAVRWIKIAGFSMQPSEFLKPFMVVIFSLLLSSEKQLNFANIKLNPKSLAFLLLFLTSTLILMQPNFSMFVLVFSVFLIQYFIAGINFRWTMISLSTLSVLSYVAYTNLSHVKYRLDNFFSPNKTNFQIEKSLNAYKSGGFLGKGPGQGTVKKNLPDSHTDFILPVIAEEYGGIVCILIVSTILAIFMRGLYKISLITNKFKVIACTGLLSLLILQAFTNVAVSIQLIPTTGVTFPFVSYGGSSLVSSGIIMGMVLSLTKKEFKEKGLIYE